MIILFQKQNRKTMILWAHDLAAESIVQLTEKYPEEMRPREALAASKDCHAFATEISSKEDIAICHAIGQACAVVHTASHALGYPIYDLTSIIYRLGIHPCIDAVERRKQEYSDKVFYWSEHFAEYSREWADFLNK